VRSRLPLALLAAAAALIPGAAAAGGIGLSASPVRLRLTGSSGAEITLRNPGARTLAVDVTRAGFARSIHGRALVRPARRLGWLRVRPRSLRLAPGAAARLRVTAAAGGLSPGDHPALVLVATRPLGARRVRVRLRVGVVVMLHVPGRIVRRLELKSLEVRRRGRRRLLDLRLVNRGNVTEEVGAARLRLALVRRGRVLARLRPRRLELLPHSAGIAEFSYRGRLRGAVVARAELRPQRIRRSYRIRI